MAEGSSGGSLGLMALNDTKAGMGGLDKESISKVNNIALGCRKAMQLGSLQILFSQVIEEASRGSKFYAKKQADQAKVSQQVKELKASLASFTSLELSSARADADLLVGKLRAGRILNKVSKILSQEGC